MRQYGLIGFPLGHSFSQQYFTEKFRREGISDARYDTFPLTNISELPELLASHPNLKGLNVTIPYKVAVLPFLHTLDETARAIGAVNTVCIRKGKLQGFNTDIIGFEQSLRSWLESLAQRPEPRMALILGAGGASKSVAYILQKWNVKFQFVSRQPAGKNQIGYADLLRLDFASICGIFNTTPLGTYPETATCPEIPFDRLGPQHLIYDLVYNPPETLLLQRAKARGCTVKNGLEMLQLQAEAAWSIWQQT